MIAASGFSGTPAVSANGLVSVLGALGCALLLGRPGTLEAEVAPDDSSR